MLSDQAMMEIVDVREFENWLERILPDHALAITVGFLDVSVHNSIKYKHYIAPEERSKAAWAAARSAPDHKARLPSARSLGEPRMHSEGMGILAM